MTVDYKSHTNQHEDSNIAVGLKTREYLQSQESDLAPETVSKSTGTSLQKECMYALKSWDSVLDVQCLKILNKK